MADEIKTRVTIEADEAIRNLRQVGESTQDFGKKTADAGREAESAGAGMAKLEGSVMGLARSLAMMVGTGAVIDYLRSIADEANKAHDAVAKLAKETGGLAANLGGKLGGEAVAEVAGVAADLALSPADRKQLTDFVGGMSDLRELPDKEAVRAIAEKGGILHKSTGGAISGGDAANLLQMVGARYGLDDDQALNLISTMSNSGFGKDDITSIIEKGGDQELMGMMLGARGSGLPRGDIGRKTGSMLDSLSATNKEGGVSDELAALGITADMKPSQRLRHLMASKNAGTIGDGDINRVIGNQNRVMFDALAAADHAGKVGPAMAELNDQNAAQTFINRRMSSPFAQAEATANLKALKVEADEITAGQSEYAANMALHDSDGVPGPIAAILSMFTSEKTRKSGLGRINRDIKGRWGLLPPMPSEPTPGPVGPIIDDIRLEGDISKEEWERRQSAAPAALNSSAGAFGGDNPFGYAGAMALGFGRGTVNFNGCNVNMQDPGKAASPNWKE